VSGHATRKEEPERLAAIAAFGVLVAVAAAQASDVVTFLRMIGVGGVAAELNPLVVRGVSSLGVVPLVLAKAALVVLVAASFTIVARSHRRAAATVAATGTVVGLMGAFSNVFAMT
jgi:hypothetical protein